MPATSCWLSARLRPRVPRSARVSGLAIRMTSVLCSSPSAPMLTSLTIQATLPLPQREYRPENTSSGLAPPISRQSQNFATGPLLPLQSDILERRRPRIRIDLHQPGILNARPDPARPVIIPDRREARAIVQDLLDLVQHRLAFLRVRLGQLLLIQFIHVGPAAIGIDAVARHDCRHARRGVAVGRAGA